MKILARARVEPDDMGERTKWCGVCQTEFKLSEEHFVFSFKFDHVLKRNFLYPMTSDNLSYYCKSCINEEEIKKFAIHETVSIL